MAMTDPAVLAPEESESESESELYWPLDRLKRAYMDYLWLKREEILEQQDARRYRHGAQYTANQIQVFNLRKQPVVTYNRMGRKIDAIVGLLEKLKQDPKAFPRNPNETDEAGAELATSCIRYVIENDIRETRFAACVESAAVDGYSGVELMLIEGDSPDDIDVGFEPIDPESFFYDPRSFKADFSDARYMGVGKWVDFDTVVEMYPEKEMELLGSTQSGEELTSNPDRDRKWFDFGRDRRRVRLVEIWYRHSGGWCWCLFT